MLLLALVGPVGQAAGADWVEARSAHFRLFQEGSAQQAVRRVRELEELRALMMALVGPAAPHPGRAPLDLFVLPDIEDPVTGATPPAGVAAIYRLSPGGAVVLARAKALAGPGGEGVLRHEVAHHLLAADWRHRYPAWYVEGVAEYLATARFETQVIEHGRADPGRLAWLGRRPWLPPERVLRWQGEVQGPAETALLYAQSWLLAHWLLRRPDGPQRLRAYLAAYTEGADPVAAFRHHVDQDLATLNARLWAYLRDPGRATYTRIPRAAPPAIPVDVEPAASAPWLAAYVRLVHGLPAAGAAALPQTCSAPVTCAFARRVEALAEVRQGDARRALALLDKLLDERPGDPELLQWRGEARLKAEGAQEAARADFRQALATGPAGWRAVVPLIRSQAPADLSTEDFARLAVAVADAPQAPELRLLWAQALALAGRTETAVQVARSVGADVQGVFRPPRGAWLSVMGLEPAAHRTAPDPAGVPQRR